MRLKTTHFLVMGVMGLALLGVFAGVAYGQVSTGTLTGTITDAKGAAMAGVAVTVHNEGTGADTPQISNDNGVYVAPLLQPGIYDITASQAGFTTVQNKGIALQVGSTARIDITMPVASQQSLITVTTEAPLLETEKTAQSQNVSENLVNNLPVSSRRWEQFALLTPGVNPDGNSGGMSFHGLNNLYNSNSVDGANNNSHYFGGARGGTADGYAYSGEVIREFQVSSSNFTAEVGQAAGGAVNAVTKSGTNAFHGSLFENIRNPIFNALDPVNSANAKANGQKPTQTVHQQNQFGGSVGGPLIRDKFFFFAAYDGYRKINPNSVNTEGAAGIAALACPKVTIITAAQCSAAKTYVLTNVVGIFPQNLRQDIEFIKLDYQLNQANHLNVASNARDWKQASAGNGGGAPGSSTTYLQDRFVIVTWSSVIGTNKVNEARYQYGKDNSWDGVFDIGGRPQIALTGLFTYGAVNVPAYVNEYRHQISDNFSITKGTHSFKMGVDINLLRNPTRGSNQSAGVYRYSAAVIGSLTGPGQFTAATGCPSTGNGAIFCDWMLDLYAKDIGDGRLGRHWGTYNQIIDSRGAPVGSTPFAPGFAPPEGLVPPATFVNEFKMRDYAAYFQDTWKIRPNMTLNLGLRYDLEIPPPPQHGNTLTPLLAQFTNEIKADHSGIQPRVGVAYNFTKNTVLRAGGGLFVAKTPGNLYKAFVSANDGAQINCNPTSNTGIDRACFAQLHLPSINSFLFPDVIFNQQDVGTHHPYTDPGLRPSTVQVPLGSICPCGIRGISPDSKRPRAYQAQVAIERVLPGNINVSGTYIFTRAINLPSSVDANIKDTGLIKNYDVVDGTGKTQLVSSVPFFTTRSDPQATNIIAQFTGVSSRYNGMVLSVHKPMSRGFEVLANYTLSKSTDDGQAGLNGGGENFFATDGVINPFDRHGEQGYSQTDARNRFTASVIWQPGYGTRASNRVVRGVLGGWNVSSTVTASNGTRYSGLVQSTTSQCLVPTGTCPNGSLALQGGMSGALVSTGGSSIGGRVAWLPHNSFTLPSFADVDFRAAKQFTIHERYVIEVRGEAFNLFNSTLVQAVSANAYTFTAPAASGACLNTTTDPVNGHANTCMTRVATFGTPSTTSGTLLGARQLQFGARFSF